MIFVYQTEIRPMELSVGRWHVASAPQAGHWKDAVSNWRKRNPVSSVFLLSLGYVTRSSSAVTSSSRPQEGHARSSRSSVKIPSARACWLHLFQMMKQFYQVAHV